MTNKPVLERVLERISNIYRPEYQVTEEFKSRWLGPCLLISGSIWTICITLISIAAVGYEYQPVILLDYNSTVHMWYEGFIPTTQWISEPKICDGSTLKISESMCTSCYR